MVHAWQLLLCDSACNKTLTSTVHGFSTGAIGADGGSFAPDRFVDGASFKTLTSES